jgi:hypothetical protein
MLKKNKLKVVKVYLSKDEKMPDRPQAFPKIPRLYLELLENKLKIKQDLINTEHIPIISDSTLKSVPEIPINKIEIVDSEEDKNYNSGDEIKEKIEDKYEPVNKEYSDNDNDNDRNKNSDNHKEYSDTDNDRNKNSYIDNDRNKNSYSDSDNDRNKDSESDNDKEYRRKDKNKQKYRDNYDEDDKKSENDKESDDDLSDRLKELLNDTSSEKEFSKRSVDSNDKKSVDKYSKHYEDKFKHKSSHRSTSYRKQYEEVHKEYSPPTLAELQQQGTYKKEGHLRDINQINMSENESEDKKRELLFKFELLKKSYPNAPIPEFSIHSDHQTMQKSYDDSVRRLSLDSSVENYKTYLIGGFMLTEFIFGSFLKFDMQGFTQQQIVSMNSYEKLLIEIGEKSYVPSGSKWPVELRLLFLVIMNAAFFIVSKMIMKKTGSNLMSMINNMNTSTGSDIPVRKRKMKGPNININDIPE